jgi:hypothetical protein
MIKILHSIRCVLLAVLVLGWGGLAARAGDDPPNWTGGGVGTTTPDGSGHDVDAFAGRSSHLGRVVGSGFHVLNPANFTFAGQAVWTASNGDQLYVTFEGSIFFSDDATYPFGFMAELVAQGGTGRFAGAQGQALMTGGFTGIPGDFFYDFAGTLEIE